MLTFGSSTAASSGEYKPSFDKSFNTAYIHIVHNYVHMHIINVVIPTKIWNKQAVC